MGNIIISQDKVDFNQWKDECKEIQKYFYHQLGDRIWDKFTIPQDENYLYQKIAIAVFGYHMDENEKSKLTDKQIKVVNEIKSKCIAHSIDKTEIHLAIIFINVYMNKTMETTLVPLFRVMSHKDERFNRIKKNIFIDHTGWVYGNWGKYLTENNWDMSCLYAPNEGYYSSEENAGVIDQNDQGHVISVVDKTTSVVGIVTTVSTIAGVGLSFFPPTALFGGCIIWGSTFYGAQVAAYGVGRSIYILNDRIQHEMSIGLSNTASRQCWFNLATSVLLVTSLGTSKIISSLAETGQLVSTVTKVAVTTLNITSTSFAGLGIISALYELAKKDKCSPLDILQLSASIFFLFHSIVSFKTASRIIKDAQEKQLTRMRNSLTPEQQIIHDALLAGSNDVIEHGKVKAMKGRAKFIREIRKIDNVEEFYSNFEIKTNGQLNINSELTIHPRCFLQMTESHRENLLQLSKQLNQGDITLKEFNSKMGPIQKMYRLTLDSQILEAKEYLQNVFNVADTSDIQIGNNRLGTLKSSEVRRLEQVIKNSFNGDRKLIDVANKFAEKQGVSNVTEYCAAGEYIVREVNKEVNMKRRENSNPVRESGIKVRDHYRSQVVADKLNNMESMNKINDEFNKLKIEVEAVNIGNPRFNNTMAAANHYDKHPFFPAVDPNNNLTCEMYFNIASDMAGGPIHDITWTQDGSALQCTFISKKNVAMAIRYDNLANGTSVIATLMAIDSTDSRLYNNYIDKN